MEMVKRKTWDIPLQADKEAEMGMKALPLVATEGTMGMERTMGTERTMVMERTVVTEGTVVMGTVRRAMAVGATAKMETATMTMRRMRSPRHNGLGACSTPSSQKGDASMEDQTSQAKEMISKEHRKDGDSSRPATWQRCKQEERKEALSQVSGIPPGRGAIYRPLPEESGMVPERE